MAVTTLLLALCAVSLCRALNLAVSSSGGSVVSPIFYGIMFEEINYAGDGGLYAELVKNRQFHDNLTAWTAIGNVELTIDSDNALSSALPASLKVTVPAGTTGQVGFENSGYFGMAAFKQLYKASFYSKNDYHGSFTVDLRTNNGTVLGSARVASKPSKTWTQYKKTFTPLSAASDAQNSFAITFDGAAAAGQTLYFNLVSLFPPTFKDRENGFRMDLANTLNDIGAKFLRFPGGANLEGTSGTSNRWIWNQTIGPLIDRPGRQGIWGYYNTDGIGLVEYMNWCTDMGLEPILAVWSGLSLDDTAVSQENLQPYIDEALNMLEFLMGSPSTKYGAQRVALGHPSPWNIKYVEVGNEDNNNNGTETYISYRYQMFAEAILAKYPHMAVLASMIGFAINNQTNNKGWGDYHTYNTPDDMVPLFTKFDSADRSIPLLLGEYAVVQGNLPGGGGVDWSGATPRLPYPNLIGAIAESIYMLGAERNADVIQGMSYAPLLENIGFPRWTPDLISFTAYPPDTTKSLSYYVQRLFAGNVGTTTLPISGATPGPIYYSAMGTESKTIVKLANYNGTTTDVSISIPGGGNKVGKYTTFTAPDGLSFNSPGNDVAQLVSHSIKGSNGVFTVSISDLMVGVLVV